MKTKAVVPIILVVAAIVVVAFLVMHIASGKKDSPQTGPTTSQAAPQSKQKTPPSTSHPSHTEPSRPDSTGSNGKFIVSSDQTHKAISELNTLQIKPKGSMSKYSKHREDLFGPAWTDKATGVDMAGNGCDTRDDILARDLKSIAKKGTCTVTTGVLDDPYTGKTINYKRGRSTSSAVQIDHLVPLGNVWASGGDRLTQDQRVSIANDPVNLLAVDGPTNGAKSDQDASEWLPSQTSLHCWYVISQVTVKSKYHLTVTDREKSAMEKVLSTCPQ